MNEIILRVLLLLPWLFIIWLVGQGASGEMDLLLSIVLAVMLIPMALIVNVVTTVFVRGSAAVKLMKEAQSATTEGRKPTKRIETLNVADLPWYDPRKWSNK